MTIASRGSFLAFAGSAIAAVGMAPPRNASAQVKPLSLRIAANPNDVFASAYFGLDMGFFAKAGLDVEIADLSNGSAIAAAVVGGTVGIGVSTPIQAANAYLQGVPLVIIAAGSVANRRAKTLLLCAAKSAGLTRAKDLEGKTVALNALKNGSEVGLYAWLAENGADISKVKFIEIPFPQMAPALLRGTISAALMVEPALSRALADPDIVVLADPNAAVAPRYVSSCWFTTRRFVDENADVVRRFDRAIYETQKWANSHQPESAAILAKYAKVDVATVRAATRSEFAEQLRVSEFQPYLDAATKYGSLPRAVNASDLVARL